MNDSCIYYVVVPAVVDVDDVIIIIAVVVVVVVLLGWINVLAESSANNSKSLGSSRLNLSGR